MLKNNNTLFKNINLLKKIINYINKKKLFYLYYLDF